MRIVCSMPGLLGWGRGLGCYARWLGVGDGLAFGRLSFIEAIYFIHQVHAYE
jgi:hypothetical protein